MWRPPHASACHGQERGIAAFQLGPRGRDPGRTPWTIPTSASTWLLVTVTPVSRRPRHLSLLQSVQTLPPAPAEVLLARTSLNLSSHAMLSGRVSDISPSFCILLLALSAPELCAVVEVAVALQARHPSFAWRLGAFTSKSITSWMSRAVVARLVLDGRLATRSGPVLPVEVERTWQVPGPRLESQVAES